VTAFASRRDIDPAAAVGQWHALPAAECARRLDSDLVRGLDAVEAGRRLEVHGGNVLEEPAAEPRWRRFVAQFQETVIWILIVAAVLSGALGEWDDTVAILAIVLVNAGIGFLQEERAQQAIAALKKLSAPRARVVRDGQILIVPASTVVPGDRIEIEAGDHVPADARLCVGHGLLLQESALPGESLAVPKLADAMPLGDAPLGERCTLVHAGTVVAAGRGSALVVATGMRTELGQIAAMLERNLPEATPLQRRLAELGRVLIAACLVIVAIIFALEIARGNPLWDVLMRSVSLAVAIVPEGLPTVVTLVLAIGLQRMVAKNALVRHLTSVETLGSVTVICSDKTGTLTRNEMTVTAIVTGDAAYHVTGSGYTPQGEFFRAGDGVGPPPAGTAPCDPGGDPDLVRVLTIAARCNNASVRPAGDGSAWEVVGDPTEGALLVAALKAGLDETDAEGRTILEIPFDSERKAMSVVVQSSTGAAVMYSKGAPEAILSRCRFEQRHGAAVPLTDERRRAIHAAAAGLARRALRVLGLAWRGHARPVELAAGFEERDLVFAGLVGMIDPPRDDAKTAIRTCLRAGIRPIMITGDHPATALAIASELGLTDGGGRVISGQELDSLSDTALGEQVAGIAVFARTSAEHKLRVVRAWQRQGEIVAMTGDGVNDAPAVQAADIGIAMGLTGTDVTKEASDMVLTDDNFASIVAAVEVGRGIYDNIRKFMHYLFACNVGEVALMLVAAIFGWPAPLAAIQILWLNLITDGLPALALGLELPEHDLMHRRPRPPREPLVTWRHGAALLLHGAIIAAVAIVAFWGTYRGDAQRLPHARTVTFCVAAFSQLFFALACRSRRRTFWELGVFGNPLLIAAVVLSALLQVSIVMLPFARPMFEVGTDLARSWGFILLLAIIPLVAAEGIKLAWRAVSGAGSRGGC